MELHGMIMLHIADEKFARIRLHVENEDKRGVQLQVKPVQCPVLSNVLLLLSREYVSMSVSCVHVRAVSIHELKMGVVTADVSAVGPAHTGKIEVQLRNPVSCPYLPALGALSARWCTLLCRLVTLGPCSSLVHCLVLVGVM